MRDQEGQRHNRERVEQLLQNQQWPWRDGQNFDGCIQAAKDAYQCGYSAEYLPEQIMGDASFCGNYPEHQGKNQTNYIDTKGQADEVRCQMGLKAAVNDFVAYFRQYVKHGFLLYMGVYHYSAL